MMLLLKAPFEIFFSLNELSPEADPIPMLPSAVPWGGLLALISSPG